MENKRDIPPEWPVHVLAIIAAICLLLCVHYWNMSSWLT